MTWDDSGGWYDHVAPPHGPDGTTWGFRIPILVISAWARSNYDPERIPTRCRTFRIRAGNRPRSRSSSRRTGRLGIMGQRDVTDDDLSDMFDYTRAAPVPAFSEACDGAVDPSHALQSRRCRTRRSHRRRRQVERASWICGVCGWRCSLRSRGRRRRRAMDRGSRSPSTSPTACAGAGSTSRSLRRATRISTASSSRSFRSASTRIRRSTARSSPRCTSPSSFGAPASSTSSTTISIGSR